MMASMGNPLAESRARTGEIYDPKSMDLNSSLAPLVSQVRMAVLAGVDQEFLLDREVSALEVTAAQFAIIANVLKGHASSACELCSFMGL